MDSLITAAARALAAGDPLGALKRVALRDDAPTLALRGIAMAQLGRSRSSGDSPAMCCACLRSQGGRGPRAVRVAEAEIALVSRDLGWSAKASTPRGRRSRSTATRLCPTPGAIRPPSLAGGGCVTGSRA
jgi:hypothetical protein